MLQKQIDQWMASYEAAEAEKNADLPEVDDDGFTIVRAGGGTEGEHTIKAFRRTGISTGAFDLGLDVDEKKEKKKRVPTVKDDFYRFQWREKKEAEIPAYRDNKK